MASLRENKPLESIYSIDEQYYDKAIYCLWEVFQDSDSKAVIVKTINSLNRRGFSTIGEILNTTRVIYLKLEISVLVVKNYCIQLLERISVNPKIIAESENIAPLTEPIPEISVNDKKTAIAA